MQAETKRVFVGIAFCPRLINECVRLQNEHANLPARLIAPVDLHLTLLAPWNVIDEAIEVKRLRSIASDTESFTLNLETLEFGPPDTDRPRFLWIRCTAVPALASLNQSLCQAFDSVDAKPFLPHITLARLKKSNHAQPVDSTMTQPVELRTRVESITLFRSPNQAGSGYQVLAQVPLGPE